MDGHGKMGSGIGNELHYDSQTEGLDRKIGKLIIMSTSQQPPSLLINLRNYSPGDGNDPLENFITEAFAWQLNAHPSLAEFFLASVIAELGGTAIVSASGHVWNTQMNLGGKRPDMVLETTSMAFIFEQKAWVQLHDDQLENYRNRAVTRYGEEDSR